MRYLFETNVYMKPYNSRKYWIDRDFCKPIKITATNLQEAIVNYCNYIYSNHYIKISQNAINNKSPVYIDDKNGDAIQCGYVFTGKTYFENTQQFVDIWTTIYRIENINFPIEDYK